MLCQAGRMAAAILLLSMPQLLINGIRGLPVMARFSGSSRGAVVLRRSTHCVSGMLRKGCSLPAGGLVLGQKCNIIPADSQKRAGYL